MQLLELDLPDYRGLRDFRLDLSGARDVAILVGRNGRGKSRLLHALVEIFGSLRRGSPASFPYRMRYLCGQRLVEVTQRSANSRPAMMAGADETAMVAVRRAHWQDHLPDYVFGYQAVRDSHWNDEFSRHTGSDPAGLADHSTSSGDRSAGNSVLRPILQSEFRHLPLILLALLPQWSEKYGPYAERAVGITGFAGADLTISRPSWAKKPWYDEQPYWGLSSPFPQLFDQLASNGRFGTIPDTLTPSSYNEFRISVSTAEDLAALAGFFDSDLAMFATFEWLQALGSLKAGVRLNMHDDTQLEAEDLSSGEQQMLTILGMLRLQRGRESLFLLDEPAAHFHPGWSQRWYSSIRAMLDDGQQSQFIASTHDPALVSNIPREQIRLFRNVDGRITAEIPDVDLRGRGLAPC